MKKLFSNLKFIFALLMLVSVIAIAAGAYLAVALGMQVQASVTVLSAAGILMWTAAWGSFLVMCLRLGRGESAFTPAAGRTLRRIGWCMAGLAAVTVASALICGTRDAIFPLIELVLLPGIFLAVSAAARILRGLLEHAMALEKEQEGVV